MSVVKQALLCSKFEVAQVWIQSAQGRHINSRLHMKLPYFNFGIQPSSYPKLSLLNNNK